MKQPTSYGVTLQEAKSYIKVEHDLEDAFIDALVTASYEQVCNEANRDFVETTYTEMYDSGSTEFLATQNVYQLSSGSLVNRSDGNWVTFDDYFTGTITYKTAVSSSMPETVKIAQLMLASSWYDNRAPQIVGASVAKLDFAVTALIQPYKLVNPA